MITIKKQNEIKILRDGGKKLASILFQIKEMVAPGVKTIDLDREAERLIKKAGGEPSFKNYKTIDDEFPYPFSLCISINEEVVHGFPSERILKEGDIVSLDLGMRYKNLYTDMAITVGVGEIDFKKKKLIDVTKGALSAGIGQIKEGKRIGDIGFAIEFFVKENGFEVVRNLVGHGVGYKVHEDPQIPNFGKKGTGEILKAGMVLAIEPMVLVNNTDVILDENGWTWKTKDNSLSAHFEHTVLVTKTGAEILTLL